MKGYRTIAWNALNAILAGMQAVMAASGSGYAIPAEYMTAWMVVFAGVNALLRLITTTPVGKRQ